MPHQGDAADVVGEQRHCLEVIDGKSKNLICPVQVDGDDAVDPPP
jgi:hypothetical protein